ncbi:MAG: UDP-N-acetylglucosamine 1-carboxyvinyltransferase [Candidatus Paceibacterota bacterium]|jgi:UDP-N-acetylglucosamine 1-carboxyvinyltransferase
MLKEHFIISGLAGKKKLSGKISVSGAKNSALKAMAASILFRDEVRICNVPLIEDVARIADLLQELGAKVKRGGDTCNISPENISSTDLASEISKRLRASIVLSGPLLARMGRVSFPHPGGCVIGERPIDIFLEGFEKMGAKVSVENDGKRMRYVVTAPGKKLRGAEIFCRLQSVTVTETFMMAGVLAEGETVIKNAALEPEIFALAEFLNICGANIKGAGTSTIRIKGGDLLSARGKKFVTPPDRIEAGSFLILAALAGKDVEIINCEPAHLESLIELLHYSGADFSVGKNSIRVRESKAAKSAKKNTRRSVNVRTHEYPGFPTDLQAPMVVYLTQVKGESLVFETIFEGRLNYTESLNRMGADIVMMDPHRVIVKGPTTLLGKELESPDLRAGLAFIIAAIVAKDESVIHNVYNIDRGYENIEGRLRKLGVSIERVSSLD